MADRYQAYPEYRAFKTVFINFIPAKWKVRPLYTLCDFQQGKAHEPFVDEDGGYICVNSRFVSTGGISVKYCNKNLTPAAKSDVLMVMSDLPNGRALAKAFYVDDGQEYAVNQRVCALSANHILARYLYYQLDRSPYFLMYDDGSNQTHLTNDSFKKYPVLLPSHREQQQIANFLDHETARIDTLIEKQQQLIALLKEKRQAVISHAVTKGLNPDAPMKDSGVEWLGEVPEHWDVKRLKHISPKIGVGLVINPSTYTRDEGKHFIFGGDVKEYTFDLSKTRRISKKDSDSLLPSRLNYQDLVCIRVGYPGVTAVVTEELEGSNCASVVIIRRGKFNSNWLCALMNSWIGRQQVDLASYGAAQKQFNIADAIEFVFPVPPDEEQKKIAGFVAKELDRFNMLTKKAELQISLLHERRTALISAAVTGKIDVRNWQPPTDKAIQ
jgi:type I restriction enzyme S subunit